MATAVLTRPRSPRTPSPDQRRRAASAICSIGRLAGPPRRARYACDTCSVAWAGPEADCCFCGRPASHARDDASLLHRLLLDPVIPAARKASAR